MKLSKKISAKSISKNVKKKNESKKSIAKKVKKILKPKKIKQQTPALENFPDVQRLVHLLQVHQIELEHQNEELRLAQEELEVSRNKYVNLFDFSPTPYFTLNINGEIKEVNLSASKMFLIDRNKLVGKRFNTFVPLDERDVFNSFINTVFNEPIKQSCELNIVNKDKQVLHILLQGLLSEDALEPEKKCQLALIDLTEYKRVENSLKKLTKNLKN